MSKVSDWFENVQESKKSDNPLNIATQQEQPDVITDGVNQSTGEIEGDFDVNPAAAAAAQNEFA